jgi:hypothetical protein
MRSSRAFSLSPSVPSPRRRTARRHAPRRECIRRRGEHEKILCARRGRSMLGGCRSRRGYVARVRRAGTSRGYVARVRRVAAQGGGDIDMAGQAWRADVRVAAGGEGPLARRLVSRARRPARPDRGPPDDSGPTRPRWAGRRRHRGWRQRPARRDGRSEPADQALPVGAPPGASVSAERRSAYSVRGTAHIGLISQFSARGTILICGRPDAGRGAPARASARWRTFSGAWADSGTRVESPGFKRG